MNTWKPAFGFEGIYEISDCGEVRRVLASTGARVGAILKPYKTKTGYLQFDLRKGGKYLKKYAHRLVLQTFVGDSDLTANHKNGVKSDNRVGNLEWISNKENLLHACRVLGKRQGKNHWASKLNAQAVRVARKLAAQGVTHEVLAKRFGVSRVTMTCAIIGRTWKHVSA